MAGIVKRLKEGKNSVLRMSAFNAPVMSGTTPTGAYKIGGDVTDAAMWAEEIMRDRGVKKIQLGLFRDLVAMGKGSGTKIYEAVEKHFEEVTNNLKALHTTFLKELNVEYNRGKDVESAKLAAYDAVKGLITSAISQAELTRPIGHIVALSKNASLQVSGN